jgi:uncharacterized protein (TIGR03382 family)
VTGPGNPSCGAYVCSGSSPDCPTVCQTAADCLEGLTCTKDHCKNVSSSSAGHRDAGSAAAAAEEELTPASSGGGCGTAGGGAEIASVGILLLALAGRPRRR